MRRFDPPHVQGFGARARRALDEVASDNFGYAERLRHSRRPARSSIGRTALRAGLAHARRHPPALAVADLDGHTVALSPDGRRIAYVTSGRRHRRDGPGERRHRIGSRTRGPRTDRLDWSAVAECSRSRGCPGPRGWEIHTKAADGSGPGLCPLFQAPGIFAYLMAGRTVRACWARVGCEGQHRPLDHSPDGRAGRRACWRTPAAEFAATYSSDGRWIVTVADGGTFRRCSSVSVTDRGRVTELNAPGLRGAVWSGDGYEVFLGAEGLLLFDVVSFDGGFRQSAAAVAGHSCGTEGVVGYDQTRSGSSSTGEKPGSVEHLARSRARLAASPGESDARSRYQARSLSRQPARAGSGMGEVFRARHAARPRRRHQGITRVRQIPERLARFQREARLLASLSHTNVAGIFGLEEAGGALAPRARTGRGRTLTRGSRAAMPVREALDLAGAGRRGDRAREGIVHRDLKPGNIMLTPSRTVKVLDFGLSPRAARPRTPRPWMRRSPTMALSATGAGVIPARRHYAEPRAGARPCRGPARRRVGVRLRAVRVPVRAPGVRAARTVSDVMVRVLERKEPDWNRTLPSPRPPGLVDLLRRCLTRIPRNARATSARSNLAAMAAIRTASGRGRRRARQRR